MRLSGIKREILEKKNMRKSQIVTAIWAVL